VPVGKIDPGRVVAHRLNRVEYDNTVRDLFFGLDVHPAAAFPVDNYAEGFDNNAEELRMSNLLLEKYMDAAAQVVNAAFASAPVRARLVPCDPVKDGEAACAKRAVGAFAERAFRRPIPDAELAPYLKLVDLARAQGDAFDVGIRVALRALLVSPNFLFRLEPDPPRGMVRALDGFEVASRLSYFLWSSLPDDELFGRARAGALASPDELVRQVRRMLADKKADALVDNLAGQWLYTRQLPELTPDPVRFPPAAFDDNLREAMRAEMHLFAREVFLGQEGAAALLRSSFTFANRRLAQHYGLPEAASLGAPLQKVALTSDRRGGLLTQGGWLTVTSHPDMTSPVKRGKWILGELLCEEPPPPPPGVDNLEKTPQTGSLRQRFEQHRQAPACKSCHSLIDPMGFALEHYDAIGRWRDSDGAFPIDATGTLAGTDVAFDGARALASALEKDPRFARCVLRKLLTYALGRGVVASDGPAFDSLLDGFVRGGLKVPALLEALAASPLMTQRRGED
jgi:hypothetical protein